MKKTSIVRKLMLAVAMLPLAVQTAQAEEFGSFGAPPKGFKVGYQTAQNGMTLIELVPQKQTVEDWTQMVTLQSMAGMKPGVEQFFGNLSASWQNACPQSSVNPITAGEENGYPFALVMLFCANNPQTSKPEFTWIKAVQGNEALYVKQYAFRYEPTKAELTNAVMHLRNLRVCDNSAGHPCNKKGK